MRLVVSAEKIYNILFLWKKNYVVRWLLSFLDLFRVSFSEFSLRIHRGVHLLSSRSHHSWFSTGWSSYKKKYNEYKIKCQQVTSKSRIFPVFIVGAFFHQPS